MDQDQVNTWARAAVRFWLRRLVVQLVDTLEQDAADLRRWLR
jgi:hypothetical protein